MNKFLQYSPSEKIVNLNHVTSIGFIESYDRNKVVFNMDYSITLKNSEKLISDYIYWETQDDEIFERMKKLVNENTEDWMSCPNDENLRRVNPEKISSIVFDMNEEKSRYKIIFNLSHNVSFKFGGLTSDFIFYKFTTKEDYDNCVKHVHDFLF